MHLQCAETATASEVHGLKSSHRARKVRNRLVESENSLGFLRQEWFHEEREGNRLLRELEEEAGKSSLKKASQKVVKRRGVPGKAHGLPVGAVSPGRHHLGKAMGGLRAGSEPGVSLLVPTAHRR